MRDKKFQWLNYFCLLLLLSAIAIVCGCGQITRQEGKDVETIAQSLTIADEKIAVYVEFPVNVKPDANSLSLAPDLSKITDKDFIKLSKTDMELLNKNGFIVLSDKLYAIPN